MEEVIDSVKRLASTADEDGRKKIIDSLRDLSLSIESPNATFYRFMYMNLQLAAVRIGIDLKVFDALAATAGSVTLKELQYKTKAAPVLLGRILRYLASIAVIKEDGVDQFAATNITRSLATPGIQAGLCHIFHTVGPAFQALPDFLADNQYQDITETTKTPRQVAHNTELSAFEWFAEHPRNAAYLNEYMAYHGKGQKLCWDVYPVEQEAEEAKDWDSEAAILVDIGGGVGHQCAEFKKRFPSIPGRVILEDLEGPIKAARSTPGVENQVYNMFEPQPIKGAKFYYLRTVLHDWPDADCRKILQNILLAMGPDSVILIDEMVLPDQNVHWRSTSLDFTMMCMMGAMERTRTQWTELLGSVGLRIGRVLTYTPEICESIMLVVKQ